jgi:hypothetical protein
MPVDQKIAQSYAQETLNRMDKSPDSLSEQERRLCRKHLKYRSLGMQLQQDVQTLRNQIQQAEATIRSKELQIADLNGKSQMALEMMVSLKFENETEADSDFQEALAQAKGEEPNNPFLTGNRLQRRAAMAQSKKTTAESANQEQGD